MRRIALRSLIFHRGKALAALCGIAFASMMLFVQGGVYSGFLTATAGLIVHIGGDVWVMSRGTQTVDLTGIISPDVGTVVLSQPCLRRARPLIVTYLNYRTPKNQSGQLLTVGIPLDPGVSGPQTVPWSISQGLPQDLLGPARFTLDESTLDRMHLSPREAIGTKFTISGRAVQLVGVTRGIRAFSTAPIGFMELSEARVLDSLPDGATRYWVLDLEHPACAKEVIQRINAMPAVQAMTTSDFRKMTESFWIGGTGAGALLAFSALLGFLVGAIIVGQTLFQITSDHLRELGTLKALGASNSEVVLFVVWQGATLAVVGSAVGAVLAILLSSASKALAITLSPTVWLLGILTVGVMCGLACAISLYKVLALEPAEVFR